MAFVQLHWSSDVLQKQTTTWVLLPEGNAPPPPYPVFYLLHGLSDDHTTWMRRTRVEVYAAGWPFVIVMPDGGRGWYTNHATGPRWAVHVGEELPAMIERTFQTRQGRAGRCIGGLSMGGYGALRVALAYPDRYESANSHSGALLGPTMSRGVMTEDEYRLTFGPKLEGSEHDLSVLARQAKTLGQLPRLRIDCGTEDHLLPANRLVHQQLTDLGIEHEYAEFPGEHNWDYWDTHIVEALAFHARHLGLSA
jgi:S-formylglutathione hydrolase FrmB